MPGHRRSYWKTTGIALAAAVICAAVPFTVWRFTGSAVSQAFVVLLLLGCPFFVVTFLGGLVVLYRDARDRTGKPDVFHELFSRAPPCRDHGWSKWIRPLLGSALRPGDLVEVKGPGEILGDLDESGMTDHLPFMPEMLAYCGRTFQVDRRIDKINDWIGGSKLRRVTGVVTLVGLRCDGTRHGGCQAACQILWKEQWLRRMRKPASKSTASAPLAQAGRRSPGSEAGALESLLNENASETIKRDNRTVEKYLCQITELLNISVPMSTWDIRQDIRPLLMGNIGVRGFLIAVLTAAFNKAQALRFGVGYPPMASQLDSGPTPAEHLDLRPGEIVRVKSKEDIGRTLVNSHNRGMWFGKETARHCGRHHKVRSRVDRIIGERSGELVIMNTPAIVLEGVTGTGELVRFCPQNDYVFWREIWLSRVNQGVESTDQRGQRPASPAKHGEM